MAEPAYSETPSPRSRASSHRPVKRYAGVAASDVQRYLGGYEGLLDDLSRDKNYKFYCNLIPSQPNGDLIENIHATWWGDYKKLELHHGYIQWLFPIPEDGVNRMAQRLHHHELSKIVSSEELKARVLRSYELMLDFIGMRIVSHETGVIERTEGYEARYRNLCEKPHNWLRITRILKSIGLLGLAHYQEPLCRHMMEEVKAGPLRSCVYSLRDYWVAVIKDDTLREQIRDEIEEFVKTIGRNGPMQLRTDSSNCEPVAGTLEHKGEPKKHILDNLDKCGCSVM